MTYCPKVAILARPQFRSARFLAESLRRMLGRLGVRADIFLDGLEWLTTTGSGPSGMRQRLRALRAQRAIKSLAGYDLFIVSDTVDVFREEVDFSLLRRFGKPILMYEVFFVPGAKYWLERLPHAAFDKFDGYLSVSSIHGCAPVCDKPLDIIGLDLQPRHPYLARKPTFSILVDFPRKGYEEQREIQLEALRKLDIEPVLMEGEYTFDEIEHVYRAVSASFVSFPEAFGVPIVQLQQYGAYIFSPERMWVMRHALLDPGSVFFEVGQPAFTENFCFYEGLDDLCEQLATLRQIYDPMTVTSRFIAQQPTYSQGDPHALWSALQRWL